MDPVWIKLFGGHVLHRDRPTIMCVLLQETYMTQDWLHVIYQRAFSQIMYFIVEDIVIQGVQKLTLPF